MKSLVSTLLLVACSDPAVVPAPRFANAPPVTTVDDRRDTPAPARHDLLVMLYMFDGSVTRPLTQPLELETHQRAAGVNALDEVPDSTWFTNRIGAHDMSLAELRTGPNAIGNPEAYTPWTVVRTKGHGDAPGVLIRDTRGEKFLIKFDRIGYPEFETATHIITGRLLWACGYNVPDDYIAHVRASDLIASGDAYSTDALQHRKPFRAENLATLLALVEKEHDGRIRVMASHILSGVPLGGHVAEGRRADDPNDVIPHELRRDLRGALPIFAWLDHGDVKQDNTLDVWVTDPDAPRRHFVKHYLLDFGKALGGLSYMNHDVRRGVEYDVDPAALWGSFVTVGLVPRPFESRAAPAYVGTGMYDIRDYDPAKWRPETPAYVPFLVADQVDWFWGAKIMMRLTRAQLAAIVDVGELSDPRASAHLTDMLVARQRATALYAFSRVSPLDSFALGPEASLCFDDLMLAYGLTTRQTHYRVRTFTRDARPISGEHQLVATGHRTCTAPLELGSSSDGYTIVRIDTQRGSTAHAVFVHLARDPIGGSFHVIGIWRA